MRYRFCGCAFAGWLLLCGVARAQEKQRDTASMRREIESATSANKTGHVYNSLLANAPVEDLQRLKNDPNTGIALAAAWRLFEKSPRSDPVPNGQRFLGFIEGRTRLQIPLRWELEVQGILVNTPEEYQAMLRPYNLRAPFITRRGKEIVVGHEKHQESILNLTVPIDTSLVRNNKEIKITVGKKSVTVPEDAIPDLVRDSQSTRGFRAVIGDKRSYFAVLDVVGATSEVTCFDQENHRVVWNASLWAYGGDTPRSGSGSWWNDADLVLSEDRLAVFGRGPRACYLEVFDVSTGAATLRFSTTNWYCND